MITEKIPKTPKGVTLLVGYYILFLCY